MYNKDVRSQMERGKDPERVTQTTDYGRLARWKGR
jgi:hypothetical protein